MHNMSANVAQRNFYSGKNNYVFQRNVGGNFGRGNNLGFGGFNEDLSGGNNSVDIIFQICFIPGHSANRCKNKYDSSFLPQKNYGRGNFNGGFRPSQG